MVGKNAPDLPAWTIVKNYSHVTDPQAIPPRHLSSENFNIASLVSQLLERRLYRGTLHGAETHHEVTHLLFKTNSIRLSHQSSIESMS